MQRLVAVSAIVVAFSNPALAEPGIVIQASLAARVSDQEPTTKAVCALPTMFSTGAAAETSAPGRTLTLSPRMAQAIRIGGDDNSRKP
jgi:hypothetical protein